MQLHDELGGSKEAECQTGIRYIESECDPRSKNRDARRETRILDAEC